VPGLSIRPVAVSMLSSGAIVNLAAVRRSLQPAPIPNSGDITKFIEDIRTKAAEDAPDRFNESLLQSRLRLINGAEERGCHAPGSICAVYLTLLGGALRRWDLPWCDADFRRPSAVGRVVSWGVLLTDLSRIERSPSQDDGSGSWWRCPAAMRVDQSYVESLAPLTARLGDSDLWRLA